MRRTPCRIDARVVSATTDKIYAEAFGHADWKADCVPVLTDAATCGVLLAMLAECGKVDLMIWSTGVSIDPGDSGNFTDARLGVALARALLAAWGA